MNTFTWIAIAVVVVVVLYGVVAFVRPRASRGGGPRPGSTEEMQASARGQANGTGNGMGL